LWTHFSYGADGGDWQSWYGTAKKLDGMGIKIVE
jgi:hypothetical protein